MASLAVKEAPDPGSEGMVAESKQCMAVVSILQREYPDVQKARTDLANNPKCPTAALTVGRYECFCKGEWAKGLPLLALSDDESLRELATQTLQETDLPASVMKLGSAWWQVAEGLQGWRQHTVRAYASNLYKKLDQELSGFDKQVVAKRLTEVGGSAYQTLSRRLICKAVPDVKPATKTNPKNEDDGTRIVKGPSQMEDWNIAGKWRQERGGIRLYGGKAILVSKQKFVGDFAITVRYKVTTGGNSGSQQLWIEAWGERFRF